MGACSWLLRLVCLQTLALVAISDVSWTVFFLKFMKSHYTQIQLTVLCGGWFADTSVNEDGSEAKKVQIITYRDGAGIERVEKVKVPLEWRTAGMQVIKCNSQMLEQEPSYRTGTNAGFSQSGGKDKKFKVTAKQRAICNIVDLVHSMGGHGEFVNPEITETEFSTIWNAPTWTAVLYKD
jgi:hypothetical protein